MSELAGLLGDCEPAAKWPQNLRTMEPPARYFDLIREMRDTYNHRLRLAESARKRGIKPTARRFGTTVHTVRKWLSPREAHAKLGSRPCRPNPPAKPNKASDAGSGTTKPASVNGVA